MFDPKELRMPPNEGTVGPNLPNEGTDQRVPLSSRTFHGPVVEDTTLDFSRSERKLDSANSTFDSLSLLARDIDYVRSSMHMNPGSGRTFPDLSPFIENFTGYSPAHLTDIKNAFRCSPASGVILRSDSVFSARFSLAPLGNQASKEYSRIALERQTHVKNEVSAQLKSKLPGELLKSQCNILRHRLGCPYAYVEALSERFCEKCRAHFLNNLSGYGHPATREQPEDFYFDLSFEDLESSDRFGNTSLHLIAALGPSLNALEVLLRRHSSINAVNTAGQTFMHVLDPCQVQDCMEPLFIELEYQGFNFDQRDVYGQTLFHVLARKGVSVSGEWAKPYASFYRWKESTGNSRKVMVRKSSALAPLGSSVSSEVAWTDRHILYSGLWGSPPSQTIWRDLHKFDYRGQTELHRYLASFDGRHSTSQEKLRELKLSFNQRNFAGWSPLHYSIQSGNIKATEFLLRNGANVHARDNEGMGVLATAHIWWASSHGGEFLYAKRNDEAQYAKIEACKALAIDAGAVMLPSYFEEWDLRTGKSSPRPKDSLVDCQHRYYYYISVLSAGGSH